MNNIFLLCIVILGNYLFTLRRWPQEIDLSLNSVLPPSKMDTTKMYHGFKLYNLKRHVLPITSARLKIGSFDKTLKVKKGEKEISFKVDLSKGKKFVKSYFYLNDGRSLGAYYVYIEPINF